jgi:hypothetical protein
MSSSEPKIPTERHGVPYGSNAIRLSVREWAIAAAITLACFLVIPRLWERVDPFEPGPDFRIPYKLSNDYWFYQRYCRATISANKTVVVGDSVVWGQYVKADETLSHYLNVLAGANHFANMGMDGMHPTALAGLLKYHGGAISGRRVLVHCNPLWMSSTKHDLQTDKEFRFNHPSLVPQFFPRIRCYTESASGRLGVVAERSIPFFAWANHLRIAYFESLDIPAWTMEHPYANPVSSVSLQLPISEEKHRRKPVLWTRKEEDKQDFPWVEAKDSFQWKSFRRALSILQGRGNKVFVLVGPFNEHMLRQNSLAAYTNLKNALEAWLRENGIPHYAPPALPSEQYADASHPLAKGYEMLAKELVENQGFNTAFGPVAR